MTNPQPQFGDSDFRTLVEPHLAHAYRTALLILLDRELARDAVQEALIRAYRGLNRLHPDSSFAAWFNRITVNEARRLARRQWRQPVPLEELPEIATAPAASPEDLLLAQEDREQIWTALAGLDELYRTVLVLRYYQGLTDAEIAEALEIPPGTVKSRLHAARQRLQQRLAAPKSPWSARVLNLLSRRFSS
ncbi:MAG TPA: sigma-70 family RNA polymerase sigma factor [Symbiobacteriaceae bacterium]|nr:sigma-70 family RNA polymerase sigma factor [Symbiobacteriaceae bacterium]